MSTDLTEGKNHYANNQYGSPANMADDVLSTYCQRMTYIAVDLGSAAKIIHLRVAIHNALALNQVKADEPFFQGSNNSTNGSDGTWTDIVQLTSDLWFIPGSYPGFALDENFANENSYQWYKISGLYNGNHTVLNEWEMFEATGTTELEDASLDFAAYYQKRQDLLTFLRAHDGIELHDLTAKLEAAGWSIEDLAAFLSAYYQEIEDLGMDLTTWGTHYDDLKSFLAAYFQQLEDMQAGLETWATGYGDLKNILEAADWNMEDLAAWLCAWGQETRDFGAALHVALETLYDFGAVLTAADGSVLKNLGIFLYTTDGEVKHDAALVLRVVSGTPAFRTITAQRVASIVHEVT